MSRSLALAFLLLAAGVAHAARNVSDTLPAAAAAAKKKPPPSNPDIKIGVANMEPIYWELQPTIEKACQFIAAAGNEGIKLLSFGEGALSGYPWWNYWTHTFDLSSNELIQANWVENSARVGHPELQPLLDCIKAAGVNVVLPMNERDNLGSQAAVFNAAVFIDSTGKVVARHRKLLPSFTERFWWTHGDGSDLVVVDMPGVGKVCAMLCWENYQLLVRYTLIAQGCEFLISPTQDMGPAWASHISSMAKQAGVYGIATGQMLRPAEAVKSPLVTLHSGSSKWAKSMTDDFAAVGGGGATTKGYFMDGGSQIVNPYGQTLVGPVYSGCTHCYPECPGAVRANSIEWARDEGCPDLDGLTPPQRCGFLPVAGITKPTSNPDDEELILWATANRDEVIAAKKENVNVGTDLVPQKIFKVTWNNRQGSVINKVDGKVSGSDPIYVDNKWNPKPAKSKKMNNGLTADGM